MTRPTSKVAGEGDPDRTSDISPPPDSSGARGVGPRPEARLNRIARRAHEIYEERGGHDGRALDDWLQAEREIDTES